MHYFKYLIKGYRYIPSILVSYWHCNKLSHLYCLKQLKFIFSKSGRSEVQNGFHLAKIKLSVGLYVSEALEKNLSPCLFQLLKSAYVPWPTTPSISKVINVAFLILPPPFSIFTSSPPDSDLPVSFLQGCLWLYYPLISRIISPF